MAGDWRGSNGDYGMLFRFTTGWGPERRRGRPVGRLRPRCRPRAHA